MRMLSLLFIVFSFSSVYAKEKLLETSGKKPDWMNYGMTAGSFEDQPGIYYVAYGEGKSKTIARDLSSFNAALYFVNYAQAVAEKEIAKIFKEQKVKNFNYKISAKNIDMSGMKTAGIYWEHKFDSKRKKNKDIYAVYTRSWVSRDKFGLVIDEISKKISIELNNRKLDPAKKEIILNKINELKNLEGKPLSFKGLIKS